MKNENILIEGWYGKFLNLPVKIKNLLVTVFVLSIYLLSQLPFGAIIIQVVFYLTAIYMIVNFKQIWRNIKLQQRDPRVRNAGRQVIFLIPIWIMIFIILFRKVIF